MRKRQLSRTLGAFVAASALLLWFTPAALGACTGLGECTVAGGGAGSHLTDAETQQTVAVRPPASSDRYEYRFEIACAGADAGASCRGAILACVGTGPGPLHDIFRRLIHANGQTEAWVRVGDTCFPPASAAPQLTYAMLLEAFHLTPWATASISTQPKGDVTLTGLRTFFLTSWSSGGFEPGEIDAVDPARMLGHRVDIRPRLVGLIYRFGDGTSEGPTTDVGGVYPTGRITHVYPKAGVYQTHLDVTWSADFRVDGGEWAPIPETVSVTGPTTTVTVKTARAVLVN